MKTEFHVHTSYSKESNLELDKLIKLAQRHSLECLIVCDHNTIEGALRLKKIAPFKVIVGEEISTKEGEIIGLFLRKEIPKNTGLKEAIAEIKKQGGLVCLPHPFDRLRRRRIKKETIEKIKDKIDIVEIFNARTIFSADNKKAYFFARQSKKVKIVGSDAHTPLEVGRTYFKIERFNNPKEFLDRLKGAHYITKKSNPLVHLITLFNKIKYNLFRR